LNKKQFYETFEKKLKLRISRESLLEHNDIALSIYNKHNLANKSGINVGHNNLLLVR